jgi:hypothetical protein
MQPNQQTSRDRLNTALQALANNLTADIVKQILMQNTYHQESLEGKETAKIVKKQRLSNDLEEKFMEVLLKEPNDIIHPSLLDNPKIRELIKNICDLASSKFIESIKPQKPDNRVTPIEKLRQVINENTALNEALNNLSKCFYYAGTFYFAKDVSHDEINAQLEEQKRKEIINVIFDYICSYNNFLEDKFDKEKFMLLVDRNQLLGINT